MKESATNLSGVILAGGKSTRFGRDKSQMVLSGQRVLERILNVLRLFPFQRVAVITAREKKKDWPEGIVTIQDDQEGFGPIGGITTALKHLPSGILVTACDMPFVSAELIAWLLDHYDPQVDAVIPRHLAGIEPLFGIYEKNFLPVLEQATRSGRYALHVVLEGAKVRFVDVPEEFSVEREFANINTPEDYERVLKLMGEKI